MKYHVEKTILINAPKEKVIPYIKDFHKWSLWSPWNIIEPDCAMEISGKPGEIGHSMFWEGSIIGSGKQTFSKIENNEYHSDLQFLKPFKSESKANVLVTEEHGKTKVTWTMDASLPFFMFFMVNMMKNWIGMDYERGLRMLKEISEKGSINARTSNNGIVDKKGFSYVGIQRTVDMKDLATTMSKDFETIMNDLIVKRGKKADQWICVYPKINMNKMQFTYIAAISDEDLKNIDLGPEYVKGEIADGKALEIKHDGSYDFLGNAWSMGMMYMQAKKYKGAGKPYEQYWNNPHETKPEDLQTSIFFPVKN